MPANDPPKTIVNSWNEWDPLKHVIVGVATGTMVQAPEPNCQYSYPNDGFPYPEYGPLPKEMEEVANEQLNNFASLLEKRGIRVDRPTPIDFSQKIKTPDWVQNSMFGTMPPRDVLLTVGKEILEAPMSQRSRWFEYLCYRPLLEQYYKEDPDFIWASAPKPRLSEASYYDPEFWIKFDQLSAEKKWMEYGAKKRWNLTEAEPLFDAADVGRFGKDLFVQRSTVTNAAGIDWLRRHYANHRVHEVNFRNNAPMHIDVAFVPLRPGLVLSNRMREPINEKMVELFKKNDWEIIPSALPAHFKQAKLSFSSIWLSMNILVLDPKTVCVEASEVEQMEQLDQLGFDVIPVPLWETAAFGGGLHCATADVYREGALEDYFPKQVPGY